MNPILGIEDKPWSKVHDSSPSYTLNDPLRCEDDDREFVLQNDINPEVDDGGNQMSNAICNEILDGCSCVHGNHLL